MKTGKRYAELVKLVDKSTLYDPSDAAKLVCETGKAKFDETVELHVRLGVDSRHADQQVRGAVVLPHGTGRTKRVLVLAKGPYSLRVLRLMRLRKQALSSLVMTI